MESETQSQRVKEGLLPTEPSRCIRSGVSTSSDWLQPPTPVLFSVIGADDGAKDKRGEMGTEILVQNTFQAK